MTMVLPLGWQVLDANGDPYSGAKAYFYQTGTTTPQDTYSDSALSTPNANPLVADSAGRFGPAYGPTTTDYKVVLKTSADVTVATFDPVQMTATPGAGSIGTSQLDDDAATNAKLANMATGTIKGRSTAGTGDPEDLTPTQAAAIMGYDYLSLADALVGIVPYASIPLAGASAADFVLDTTNMRAVLFIFDGVSMTSDGASMLARVSVDGGSNYLATGTYNDVRIVGIITPAVAAAGTTTGTSITMGTVVDSTAAQNLSGTATLVIGGAAANATKLEWSIGYIGTGAEPIKSTGYGSNSTTSQVNAIRFLPSTSTFATGTIYPIGIPKRT